MYSTHSSRTDAGRQGGGLLAIELVHLALAQRLGVEQLSGEVKQPRNPLACSIFPMLPDRICNLGPAFEQVKLR